MVKLQIMMSHMMWIIFVPISSLGFDRGTEDDLTARDC